MIASRPRPTPDPLSSVYWKAAADGTLLLQRCTSCRRAQFYPRQRCIGCSGELEWVPSRGVGTVHSFTIVRQHATPPFRDMVPYVLAIVDLEEGVRMMSNVIDCEPDDVHIGLEVEVTMHVMDSDLAIPLFRPLSDPTHAGGAS